MIAFLERNPTLTLFCVVALMLFFQLDILEVSIMEARNFITAREMLDNDHWIFTTMNGEPRYQKPPLPTWIVAVFGLLFGIKNIIALRFPSVFMVFILGIFVHRVTKITTSDTQVSLLAGLVAVTSFYVFAIPIEAPWDIYTHAFALGGIYYLFKLLDTEKFYWHHTLLAAFFIGCSILSKGPIGLYALLLPFLIAYLVVYKPRNITDKIVPLIVFVIFSLVIGGWWYAYVRYADPTSFHQIINKETGNWGSYSVKPFYYYWSFFIQSGLWTIPAVLSLLYPLLKNKVPYSKAYKFSFLWTVFALVLLSIIPEKKSRYLMPVLIPLAITISFYLQYLFTSFKNLKIAERIPVYLHFVVLSIIALGVPFVLVLYADAQIGSIRFLLLTIVSLTTGIFMIRNIVRSDSKSATYISMVFLVALLFLAPAYSKNVRSNPDYNPLTKLQEEIQGKPLFTYDYIAPELIWEYGAEIPLLKNNADQKLPDSFYLFIQKGLTKNIEQEFTEYKFDKMEIYNLNKSKNKSRLISHLFLLHKK